MDTLKEIFINAKMKNVKVTKNTIIHTGVILMICTMVILVKLVHNFVLDM